MKETEQNISLDHQKEKCLKQSEMPTSTQYVGEDFDKADVGFNKNTKMMI